VTLLGLKNGKRAEKG